MGTLDFERNAAFHDRQAAQYDSYLSANPTNALARTAFRELVTRYISAGSTILDFGCGTGLDALEYAQKGHRVLAYDNSPGMVEQLRQRCGTQIAGGLITPYSMTYPSFLESFERWPEPQAVTANFAVLNSIRDLRPLFDGLRRHMAPPGWFFASLLNPLHWSKVKTRGWWRDALRAPRGPRVHIREPYESYLHFVPEVLRAAKGFRLVGRANAGAVVRYDPRDGPSLFWRDSTARRVAWQTPAYRLLGHFVFLVMRRDP